MGEKARSLHFKRWSDRKNTLANDPRAGTRHAMNSRKFLPVLAVIRTWSNNRDVLKAVERALRCDVEHIIVVVKDDAPAHYGQVEALLAGQVEANAGRITILPMREGYTWSSALEYAYDEILRRNLRAAVLNEKQFECVLNVSNEVLYERNDLEAMVMEIESENVSAVGCTLRGKQDGNWVELGKSYIHPRNTCMMVRFSAYQSIGGYSPRCDYFGGQEDLDWLIRLNQSGREWKLLDRKITLLLKNHVQSVKEAREMKAIIAIMRMNAEIVVGYADAVSRLQ